MALRRQQEMLATFSMASMTDVIFLLLVFFLVTSTFVFPTAVDVNLPEGVEQSPLKPSTRVYLDAQGAIFVAHGDQEPQATSLAQLPAYFGTISTEAPGEAVALYADTTVSYGRVMQVMELSTTAGLKMVLATRSVKSEE